MQQVFVVAGESWLLSLDGNLHRAAPGQQGLSGLIEKDVVKYECRRRWSTPERLLNAWRKGDA